MTVAAPGTVTAGALVAELSRSLGRSDARWLVAHVTGMSGAQLRGGLEDVVPSAAVAQARGLAARCRAGEPVQYVIGRWDFRQVELELDRRVLIPRPETEQVTDVALQLLCALDTGRRRPVVADLGTGSGAIALSLAVESPVALEVWATDVSDEALAVAGGNLEAVRARVAPRSEVHLAAGSWYGALPARLRGQVDLVVSNPPYVARPQWEELDGTVRDHEPYGALVPGERGTEAIEVVVGGSPGWLAPGGALVVEIGADQGPRAGDAASSAGLVDVVVRPDLAGRDRILVARRPR